MGWNDHIANELTASLTDALSSGYLTSEDAGYAVAVKARDQGVGNLTALERDIFEFELRPLPDEVARDIEWMMELPDGWLDGPAAAETAPVAAITQGIIASA